VGAEGIGDRGAAVVLAAGGVEHLREGRLERVEAGLGEEGGGAGP
jgi:hypothetical protein